METKNINKNSSGKVRTRKSAKPKTRKPDARELLASRLKGAARVKKKGAKRRTKNNILTIALVTVSAIGILIFIILPFFEGGISGKGAKIPEGSFRFGIDISHNNQGKIQWDSLMVLTDSRGRTTHDREKAKEIYPVDFVFIKATEGATHKDRNFKRNWEEAGKRKIKRGAYHFFRSSKDPETQARNYIRVVNSLRYKDFPPVLDIETIHRGCKPEDLNRKALVWLRTVHKHFGRKPIVYTYEDFAQKVLSEEITQNYPLWIAHYEVESPETDNWQFWQFTDKALVYGIEGNVDLNVIKIAE